MSLFFLPQTIVRRRVEVMARVDPTKSCPKFARIIIIVVVATNISLLCTLERTLLCDMYTVAGANGEAHKPPTFFAAYCDAVPSPSPPLLTE